MENMNGTNGKHGNFKDRNIFFNGNLEKSKGTTSKKDILIHRAKV